VQRSTPPFRRRNPGSTPQGRGRGGFAPSANRIYIAFNKPYGVLSQFTLSDGSEKTTLAEFGFPPGVYPIGRLDYDSEGLLLLSDDPALNKNLLDPSKRHERTYLAQVEGIPTPEAIERLRDGVIIEGRRTLPARAGLLDVPPPSIPPRSVPIRFRREIPTSWITLSLVEGRNRQVRRMTAAAGNPTLRLVRIAIGALRLEELALAPGEWRRLTPGELRLALQQ
jgi:23S rRNA pseudouridine2457 synthase